MKNKNKSNKINYMYYISLIIFAVILLLFMIDGKKLYTISNNYFREYSEEKIIETIPSTNNIQYLAEIHENLSSVFIYKTDDKYAIVVFNNSIFIPRSSLSNFIYKIPEIDGFRINESNQIYNNNFIIKSNDKILIENDSVRNSNLIINIVNFIIIISIATIGTIYSLKNKLKKEDK